MPRRASARVSSGRPGLPNGVGLRNEVDTRTVRPARQSPARPAAPPPPIESRTPPRVGVRRPACSPAGIARRRHHARDVQRDRRAERRQGRHPRAARLRAAPVRLERREPARRTTRAEPGDTRHARPPCRATGRPTAQPIATANATPCGSSSARKPRPASSDSTAAPAAQSGSQPSGLSASRMPAAAPATRGTAAMAAGVCTRPMRAREVTEISEGPARLQHGATETEERRSNGFFLKKNPPFLRSSFLRVEKTSADSVRSAVSTSQLLQQR